ncbi:hypothetical protein GCM10009639_54990 [Kitasatospora putterlickiae]|uniref:Uncharacterized protein n=1 Tax=Kitasatospora putterlickiae TaxID=221725 RepID=A0ABP4J6B1_9ACTN
MCRGGPPRRAARPGPLAEEAAGQALFHGELSTYLAAAIASGLWQPEQAELPDGLTARHFEEL